MVVGDEEGGGQVLPSKNSNSSSWPLKHSLNRELKAAHQKKKHCQQVTAAVDRLSAEASAAESEKQQ